MQKIVCSECLKEACWNGEFVCDKAKTAGTLEIEVAEPEHKTSQKVTVSRNKHKQSSVSPNRNDDTKTVVEELIEEKMMEFDKKFPVTDREKHGRETHPKWKIKDFLKSSLTLAIQKQKNEDNEAYRYIVVKEFCRLEEGEDFSVEKIIDTRNKITYQFSQQLVVNLEEK